LFSVAVIQRIRPPHQSGIRAEGGGEDDLRVLRPVELRQRLDDAVADLGHLVDRVRQFVDPVHHDDDFARLHVGDHPDQGKVDRRQRLVRGQNDDAETAFADRPDGDLLADHERVVHTGRVADAKRHRQLRARNEKLGGFRDVRETPLVRAGFGVIFEIVAKADVTLDQIAVDMRVIVLLAQQHLELVAQPLAGFLPHHRHLFAYLLKLVLRTGTGGKLTDPATAIQKTAPFLHVEETEAGTVFLRRDIRVQVQRRDDAGPRVDVCRQQVGRADHRIHKRRLAGLHLADHRDRRFGMLQLMMQFPGGAVRGFVADLAQTDQRLTQLT
jgi:hypothetical protein